MKSAFKPCPVCGTAFRPKAWVRVPGCSAHCTRVLVSRQLALKQKRMTAAKLLSGAGQPSGPSATETYAACSMSVEARLRLRRAMAFEASVAGKHTQVKPSAPPKRKCKVCGKVFVAPTGRRVNCSRLCYSESVRIASRNYAAKLSAARRASA